MTKNLLPLQGWDGGTAAVHLQLMQRQEISVLSKIQKEKALPVKCDVSKMLQISIDSILWAGNQKQRAMSVPRESDGVFLSYSVISISRFIFKWSWFCLRIMLLYLRFSNSNHTRK